LTLLRLALRNLIGAGLRTTLNAIVLSLVIVTIITAQALLKGMNEQTAREAVAAEYGGGQVWHPLYDPYDPLTIVDAHGPLPPDLVPFVDAGRATAILVVQGAIYPEGRLQPVLLKGIDPRQEVVDLPTQHLMSEENEIPVLIGGRMARASGLSEGDVFVVQWRDRNGTFDAREARVAAVVRTPVQSVDKGILWVALDRLRAMTDMPGEATLVTLAAGTHVGNQGDPSELGSLDEEGVHDAGGWRLRDLDWLLTDIQNLIRSKMMGSMFIYAILLFLALLAIFDAQVFSIFKRQREIGTLVALGMTRRAVAGLLTLEGVLIGLLAGLLAVVYGVPLLSWFARTGWKLPETTDSYGFALGDVLYPIFSADVVIGTGLVIWALTALVSYLPTRRIARVNPTDALRGRVF
jgi:ABC-type lipoprotein release transport system permease subunit